MGGERTSYLSWPGKARTSQFEVLYSIPSIKGRRWQMRRTRNVDFSARSNQVFTTILQLRKLLLDSDHMVWYLQLLSCDNLVSSRSWFMNMAIPWTYQNLGNWLCLHSWRGSGKVMRHHCMFWRSDFRMPLDLRRWSNKSSIMSTIRLRRALGTRVRRYHGEPFMVWQHD